MTDWLGKQIAHYRILEQLGQGGMGVVFLAEDVNIGRRVVLKMLRRDLASDPRVEERFHREARACAAVTHPNITTIFEVNRHEGSWYICMEYIDGRTLRAKMRDGGPVDIAEAIRVATCAAEALGAAHARGIVHRDIKPENIMITATGATKVLDFGLAAFTGGALEPFELGSMKTVDRLTSQGVAIGTLHYMSPEQARGQTVSPASDVFSLGAVLYEMLAGIPPFRGDNSLAVLHAIAYDQPPALALRRPETPALLEQIVRRALAKEPRKRFADGDQLAAELSRIGRPGASATGPVGSGLTGPARVVSSAAGLAASGAISFTEPGGVTGRYLTTSLVGRDREMGALLGHLERAMNGEGSLVLISGEAGVGKTRLVTELGRTAEEHGARFVSGRCLFREGSLPYHPFVEASGHLVASLGLENVEEFETYVRDRLPAIAGRLPILRSFLHPAQHETTSLIADKEHLLDAITALFLAFARERCLVLHIDDLHWADEASLDLLLCLARNLRDSNGLVLGTYRHEEIPDASRVGHPLSRLLDRMTTGDLYAECRIGRLDEAETAAVIASALRGADLPAEFLSHLHAETAGNPFYVLETLKLLVEDGTLDRAGDGWRLSRPVDRVLIPGRVHDVVTRRLTRVAAQDREILEIAAAEGMVFHSSTLAACVDLPRLKILGALQRSEKEHQLIHAEKDLYRFDHPLIREVLYDGIIPELRREYHRLIAGALAGRRAGRPGEDAAIGWQYLEAGEEEAAVGYLLDAADQARRLHANAEACTLLDRADAILSEAAERARSARQPLATVPDLAERLIRLHKERGRIAMRLGDHARAMKEFRLMHRAARDAGRGERQAHALCLMADLEYAMGEYGAAFDHAREAQEQAGSLGDKRSLAHALGTIGAVHFYRAEYEEALKAHWAAIAIQQEIDDLSGYADNLGKIGNIHLLRGEHDEAEKVYEAALGLGRQSGNLLMEAEALNNLGLMHYYRGNADEALDYLSRTLEHKRAIGDRRAIARTLNNLALVQEMRGDFPAAVETHREALAIVRELGDQGTLVPSLNNLANVYEKMGRYGDALEACEEALATAEAIGDLWVLPYPLNSLGQIRLCLNDVGEAEALFQRALRSAREKGHKVAECLSLKNLGEARAHAGDAAEAVRLLEQACALAADQEARDRESECLYRLGLLHADRGDASSAGACAETLTERASGLGLCEVDIRQRHLAARVALLRKAPVEAARLLEEGAALARRIGLKEMEWQMRADRAVALGPRAGAQEECREAAAIIEEIARHVGSAPLADAYRRDPGRARVLRRASEGPAI